MGGEEIYIHTYYLFIYDPLYAPMGTLNDLQYCSPFLHFTPQQELSEVFYAEGE